LGRKKKKKINTKAAGCADLQKVLKEGRGIPTIDLERNPPTRVEWGEGKGFKRGNYSLPNKLRSRDASQKGKGRTAEAES